MRSMACTVFPYLENRGREVISKRPSTQVKISKIKYIKQIQKNYIENNEENHSNHKLIIEAKRQ